jgi:putative Mg2+ transporter-C (MgtC) family protein
MIFELEKLAEVALKLGLALVCGGLLGIERGRKKRPAGFRTYMLVCIGATLVMMTNDYISTMYQTGDPSRMGAQVISGIGFLGAGTIITTGHNRVKGLTTAAGLWASACVGLAIGIGFYEGAILGTVMIFFAMVTMHTFDEKITASARVVTMYIEFDRISSLKNVTAFLKEKEIKLSDIETEEGEMSEAAKAAAIMTLRLPNNSMRMMLGYMLNSIEGVTYVEEL